MVGNRAESGLRSGHYGSRTGTYDHETIVHWCNLSMWILLAYSNALGTLLPFECLPLSYVHSCFLQKSPPLKEKKLDQDLFSV